LFDEQARVDKPIAAAKYPWSHGSDKQRAIAQLQPEHPVAVAGSAQKFDYLFGKGDRKPDRRGWFLQQGGQLGFSFFDRQTSKIFTVNAEQIERIEHDSHLSTGQKVFSQLHHDEQIQMLRSMPESEREQYLPHGSKEVQKQFQETMPAQPTTYQEPGTSGQSASAPDLSEVGLADVEG
jgi:hypothetical protein